MAGTEPRTDLTYVEVGSYMLESKRRSRGILQLPEKGGSGSCQVMQIRDIRVEGTVLCFTCTAFNGKDYVGMVIPDGTMFRRL